jgi:uncharacterized protein
MRKNGTPFFQVELSDCSRFAAAMPAQLATLLIACALLAVATAAGAQSPLLNPGLRAPSSPASYPAIRWQALAPPGWDGMQEFRRLDLAAMQDGDPRAAELLKRMRAAWDRAPVNLALIGQGVRIAGYVVPLEETREGLKEFLLVPYHGACIHTPPPPANQIVHVKPRQPVKGVQSMDTVWVAGVLSYVRNDSYMGTSSWSMPTADVQPYGDGPKAEPLR